MEGRRGKGERRTEGKVLRQGKKRRKKVNGFSEKG
jgi:hypothetical protein